MNALAVAVLAGGGRGEWQCGRMARATRHKANACTVAAQEMLPLAVGLREVFLVTVALQEVVARAAPMKEVLARVVAMQKVLALSVAGWWVDGVSGGRGEAGGVIGTSADKGARVYARYQGPCTSLLPRFCCTTIRVAYATRQAVWAMQRGVEGARTLSQSTASGKPDDLHPGGDKVQH